MKLLKTLSRLLVATATIGLLAAPIASADQGRRGDNHRGAEYSRGHNDRGANRGHDRRNDYRGDRRNDYRGRDDRRHDYRGKHDRRDAYRHHDNRRYYSPPRSRAHYAPPRRYYALPRHYAPPRHYVPRYSVGGYYRPHGHTVYIRDYHRYGLYDPPRGYYWARDYDRGDAILASVATGAIIGLAIGVIAAD
jgi:Ni/Co efflux regulator RcnB